jgi:NDP-sugar pyrophosphorylase family protein
VRAIVLAGGLGTRLRPLTEGIPKPLLPLAGTPLLDIILHQLKAAGFDRVTLALFYRAEQIVDHVGDGAHYGLEVDCSVADRRLGTAGPLGLVSRPDESCLVLNADVLSDINFGALMAHHRAVGAAATVVLCRFAVSVPFGVIEVSDDDLVSGYQEKPTIEKLVNAGIYVLEPLAWDKIPFGHYLDMPDLIARGLRKGHRIATFQHHGEWHDIGTTASYQQGEHAFAADRGRYLSKVASPSSSGPAARG